MYIAACCIKYYYYVDKIKDHFAVLLVYTYVINEFASLYYLNCTFEWFN